MPPALPRARAGGPPPPQLPQLSASAAALPLSLLFLLRRQQQHIRAAVAAAPPGNSSARQQRVGGGMRGRPALALPRPLAVGGKPGRAGGSHGGRPEAERHGRIRRASCPPAALQGGPAGRGRPAFPRHEAEEPDGLGAGAEDALPRSSAAHASRRPSLPLFPVQLLAGGPAAPEAEDLTGVAGSSTAFPTLLRRLPRAGLRRRRSATARGGWRPTPRRCRRPSCPRRPSSALPAHWPTSLAAFRHPYSASRRPSPPRAVPLPHQPLLFPAAADPTRRKAMELEANGESLGRPTGGGESRAEAAANCSAGERGREGAPPPAARARPFSRRAEAGAAAAALVLRAAQRHGGAWRSSGGSPRR
jgi:hypothetical protein